MSTVLEVRLEHLSEPIGYLSSADDASISFSYSEDYLAIGGAMPLSISLPLAPLPYSDQETRTFFDNLLPENDLLHQTMEREGIARDDIVGLLFHLGADCPGAISCLPLGESPIKIPGDLRTDYNEVNDDDILEIVRRLADRESLPDNLRDPSPIAGVQRKIAVSVLPNGKFALPKAGLRVPTTHILKVPRRGKGRETRLEAASAQMAAACGLLVAQPEVLAFGEIEALLIARFDRRVEDNKVARIHQEDFAQALGLPSRMKYERYGRRDRSFNAVAVGGLLKKTADPASSSIRFIIATIFNMAIGNSDNHAKNHALIYDVGSVPRLAPLYDLLPVRLDPGVRHDFSFKIGTASSFEDIDKNSITRFMEDLGVRVSGIQRIVDGDFAPLIKSLDKASSYLVREGLKDFDDLIGRELQHLVEILSLKVALRPRDHFEAAPGGGWRMGS